MTLTNETICVIMYLYLNTYSSRVNDSNKKNQELQNPLYYTIEVLLLCYTLGLIKPSPSEERERFSAEISPHRLDVWHQQNAVYKGSVHQYQDFSRPVSPAESPLLLNFGPFVSQYEWTVKQSLLPVQQLHLHSGGDWRG